MGGTKKKSMAQMEKEQESRDEGGQQAGETQKGKKGKETKGPPQQQKKLPFLVPKMTDQEMMKSLSPLKAITVLGAARAMGVNASIATGLLRGLESRKLVTKVGGFSGHYVWTAA